MIGFDARQLPEALAALDRLSAALEHLARALEAEGVSGSIQRNLPPAGERGT